MPSTTPPQTYDKCPRELEVMAREWESLNAKAELARMHRDGHCREGSDVGTFTISPSR